MSHNTRLSLAVGTGDEVTDYDLATGGNYPTTGKVAQVGLYCSTANGQVPTPLFLGQGLMAAALPVVIASNQSALPVTDNSGSLTVDAPVGTPVFVRLSDGSAAITTLAVSATSLPLPSGAATAAKQPALGTAGTASADVLTVQGIASMTALKVDGSGVTQPVSIAATVTVSGTVAATQSGTWTVQPGNTANTTAWLVTGTGGTFPATQSGTWNITNVSGTVSLPTGAATAAKQPALGTAGSASADVITIQGAASMTAVKVDGSAVTQPVSGTVTANAGSGTFTISGAVTQSGTWNVATVTTVTTVSTVTSLTQFNGVAITLNKGTSDAGTLRVSLGDGSQTIGALTANQSVNVAQVNGVTVTMGNGVSGTGVQRVTLASDSTGQVSLAAGSNLIGKAAIDQTTVGTTNGVTPVPATSGGPSTSRVKSGASTNATSVKASAGQVYGWYLFNNTASAKFFKFYNKASSPTVGSDTPLFTVPVPANGGTNIEFSMGVPFGTGIAYAITGVITDADTTSTAADDVHGVLLYK